LTDKTNEAKKVRRSSLYISDILNAKVNAENKVNTKIPENSSLKHNDEVRIISIEKNNNF
jgi:hypothetical protein